MLHLFKALADQTRLRLIAILQLGEFTVQELVQVLGMGQSRISRHLKILLDAGVVRVKREGTWAYYRLQVDDSLFAEMQSLLTSRLPDLENYQLDRTALTEVLAARRQRSQVFFEHHSRQWDRMARELLPTPDYLPILLAELGKCDKLLEVGVGTGKLLSQLCASCNLLTGVDHSPAMLAAARELVAEQGLKNIELRLGQMECLPVPAASVDAALINMALHHASEPQHVLAELARVLRPSGLLLLSDLRSHEQEWVRDKLADQWLGFQPADLSSWCEAAGLRVKTCQTLTGQTGDYPVVLVTAIKPRNRSRITKVCTSS